ncbi:LysR family transcriptional regulator [Desulfosporosinus lacus]|uniref:DNA-binding transcriptional regulator, LysR family n=1 Tax=Desulfosporosinus lacus DSM 15449 TaxID=1121420 RepID=A0A1M6DP83_9FIRM|nr:LysR family transcriptional regulator [Desulfosporosinus lacus]SHI75021.1 DNA-binding transcriptional regulator, LysR family [Desulfosporosinus lacus DSM 15449]
MYKLQLDTFIKVADSGSFSKAAEELHISPTAVIKQINLLESDLNLRLLDRTHRGITLTEAGKSLYKDAKYLIQYSKDSLVRARNAMQGNENIIRIGTSLMTPTQFLMELWPKIHEHCPELKFQLVPFENTPENAREILKNLGQNIDLVAGLYDGSTLKHRGCAALELSKEPICCAVSIHHRLAAKSILTVSDLIGENLMLIRRGWNSYVDLLRDNIWENYPQINVVDFPFYDVNVFNQCESGKDVLMAVGNWENVHPLLKILPVQWDYVIPFGLLYSPNPSPQVLTFIRAVAQVFELDL